LVTATWLIYNWNRKGRDPIELIILVLGFIVIAFFGFLIFRAQIYKLIVRDARVLVCSLGDNPTLIEEVEGDAEIYRNHFPAIEVFTAPKLVDLLETLLAGDSRILHIISEFAEDGMLVEAQGTRANVSPLFDLCRTKKLLFVYFGGNIPEENRGAVFDHASAARVGHDFPLVVTTDRGTEFYSFLDGLLREIGKGLMLGNAWLKLRPQDAGPGAPQPTVDPGPEARLLL
jgi:hypothetical protein